MIYIHWMPGRVHQAVWLYD